jgi:tetratricopeptide (TPR) repeat protein
MVEGKLGDARKAFEEALEIRNGLDQKARAAGSRLDLTLLLLEEGRPGDAANLARGTIEVFRNSRGVEDEAVAHALVARGELAQGRTDEATAAVDRAVALLPRMETRSRALMVRIFAAQVTGSAGDTRESLRSLASVLAEASRIGLVGIVFEARLALGEMEVAAGRRVTGLARLAALKKDADARGFALIARKAQR